MEVGGSEELGGVVGCFDVPPAAAPVDGDDGEDKRERTGDEGAAVAGCVGLLAGWEARFAYRGGGDADDAQDEDKAEDAEQDAHGSLHL